jgi:hypothetical protein
MGIKLYELYTTKEGVTHITSSIGIWKLKGHQFDGPEVGTGIMYDSKGNPEHQNIKMRNYLAEDSIRSMAQGLDSVFYFVAHDNFFLWRPNGEMGGWAWPPFNFPKNQPCYDLLMTSVVPDSALLAPFFGGIQLRNGGDLATLDYNSELLKKNCFKV